MSTSWKVDKIMGLIKYGPLATEVAGSVGGVVFARAKSCKTVRAKSIPVYKLSATQQTVRGNLSVASSYWRQATTQSQRQLWNEYAATCPMTNTLGETYYLSGNAMFTRHQALAPYLYDTDTLDAPLETGYPQVHTFDAKFYLESGAVDIVECVPSPSTGEKYLITFYKATPTSISRPKLIRIAQRNVGPDGIEASFLDIYPAQPMPYEKTQATIRILWADSNRRISLPVTYNLWSTAEPS